MRTERQRKNRHFTSAVLGVCAIIAVPGAIAQNFPARPLRMIVPWAPGGAADILVRTLGQKMAEHWNQQVVVDNRPGANNAADTLAESPIAGSGVGAPVI